MTTEIISSMVDGLPFPLLALERARRYDLSRRSERHYRLAALIERTIGAIGGPLLRADDESVLAEIDEVLESNVLHDTFARLQRGLRDLSVDAEDADAELALEDVCDRQGVEQSVREL